MAVPAVEQGDGHSACEVVNRLTGAERYKVGNRGDLHRKGDGVGGGSHVALLITAESDGFECVCAGFGELNLIAINRRGRRGNGTIGGVMDVHIGGLALDAYTQGVIVCARFNAEARSGDGGDDFRIAEKTRFRIDDVVLRVCVVAAPVGVVIDSQPAIGLDVFQTLWLSLCKYKMLVVIRPHANPGIAIGAVEPTTIVAVGIKNVPVRFVADVPFQVVAHHAGDLRGIIVEGHRNC